jgi:tetraacyldisaccharide 4'-kinase
MRLNYLYELATDRQQGSLAGLIKFFLFILSLLYGLSVTIVIFFMHLFSQRLSCKVISVGNITLGGTGKTVLVEYLARYLKNQGRTIAVLSRGYKRNTKYKIPNAQFGYPFMGDEPYMLRKKLSQVPVIVDNNRIRATRKAIMEHATDTVILDDGLQQWRIKKDLEIVTIDATNPFGNLHLLPRGILRQPLSTLANTDIFVLTKTNLNPDITDLKGYLEKLNPRALICEAKYQPAGFYRLGQDKEICREVGQLREQPQALLCGIADPDSFENLIRSLEIEVKAFFSFPDHHPYVPSELERIIREAQLKGAKGIITTEKDAVRLEGVLELVPSLLTIFVLSINLEIVQDEIFNQRIRALY